MVKSRKPGNTARRADIPGTENPDSMPVSNADRHQASETTADQHSWSLGTNVGAGVTPGPQKARATASGKSTSISANIGGGAFAVVSVILIIAIAVVLVVYFYVNGQLHVGSRTDGSSTHTGDFRRQVVVTVEDRPPELGVLYIERPDHTKDACNISKGEVLKNRLVTFYHSGRHVFKFNAIAIVNATSRADRGNSNSFGLMYEREEQLDPAAPNPLTIAFLSGHKYPLPND